MKGPNGQLPRSRPDVRLYLFHGSDEAGATDLARRLIAALPAGERVDLDGATLKREPGRLADEAASMSLFGDARLVRAAPIGEESVEAVTLLLDADRSGNPVVAVAPSVKASGKLVALANAHPAALSIACYPLGAADLDKTVQAVLAGAGLRPAPGLARRIAEASGGDRAVIAREVEKLALFLDADVDRPRDVDVEALDAIGADNGEVALAQAADALVEGRAGDLGLALGHLDAGGASAIPWLRGLQRRLVTLAELQTAIGRGEQLEAVMKRNRIFAREEQARASRDLRRWTPARIAAALDRIRASERDAVSTGNAGAVVAEHVILDVARRLPPR